MENRASRWRLRSESRRSRQQTKGECPPRCCCRDPCSDCQTACTSNGLWQPQSDTPRHSFLPPNPGMRIATAQLVRWKRPTHPEERQPVVGGLERIFPKIAAAFQHLLEHLGGRPMIGRSAGMSHGLGPGDLRGPDSDGQACSRTWRSRPFAHSPVARRLCSKSDLELGSASGQAVLATIPNVIDRHHLGWPGTAKVEDIHMPSSKSKCELLGKNSFTPDANIDREWMQGKASR